jgi:hypothetical protein
MPRTLFRRANPTRRNGVPDWRDNGFPDGFALDEVRTYLHDDSIDFYLLYTATGAQPISVQVRARRSADASDEFLADPAAISAWVDTDDGLATVGRPSIQGSVLDLPPETTWTIRLRITFDDGDIRDFLLESLTTTAVRTYTDTDTLTPTRYLNAATGSDSNDGLTAGTPWLTWDYMVDTAPTAAIVEVADGYYVSSVRSTGTTNLERNASITIYAADKRIGDDGADLANGNLVRVEPPTRSSPTGSGHPNSGVWTLETLTGPGRYGNPATSPGDQYPLYKWAASGILGSTLTFMQGTYRATRDGTPERLPHHYRDADYLLTAGGFAEYLYTNQLHRYGFWVDTTGDIYCRIPRTVEDADPKDPGLDPNTLYTTFSDIAAYGVNLKNGTGTRISGVNFIGFGTGIPCSPNDVTIDHCWFQSCRLAVVQDGDGQWFAHNRFEDTNLTAAVPDHKTLDWGVVKEAGVMQDGTAYGSKIGGASEGNAVRTGTGAGGVIEHNLISGTFNGVGGAGAENETQRLNSIGMIVRDNVFDLLADDCNEPEGGSMLRKIYRNRFSRSISVLSTGPVHGGPVYFHENVVGNMSARYVGRNLAGATNPSGKVFSKFSSSSEPQCTIYVRHNTFYNTDINITGQGAIFAGDSAGGSTSSGAKVHEKHHWYGNFIVTTYRIMDEINETNTSEWYDDYNFYFTYDKTTPSGIKVGGTHYTNASASLRMANMRAAKNVGIHSNLVGATTYEMNDADGGTESETFFEAQLVDPAGGDFSLVALSPLRNLVPACPITALRAGAPFNVGYQP